MNTNATTLWLAIGWTMLHFLWIGCVIWAGAAVVLRQLRAASAELRYAVALASLVLLALAPSAIAWQLACASASVWSGMPTGGQDQARPANVTPAREDGGVIMIGEIKRLVDHAPATRIAESPIGFDRPVVSRPSWLSVRLDDLAACLPWLWLVGSPLTFAWLAVGLAGAERLRRRSLPLEKESDLSQLCRRLAVGFGIGRDVAVAVCDRVATPVLVGIVRPLILLPAAAMGGWGPEEIEMVLLHELAHVRRWDNLVNLLQRLVESLLFFHPAVWIVSGWIRLEREHCCDRIVVLHTGRAYAYAEMLLALASEPRPLVAISVALVPRRKHLVRRIRHILTPREDHPMKLSRSLILIVAAIILAPAFWIASLAQSQPFQKAQTSQNVSLAGASAPGQAEPVKLKDEKANRPALVIQGKPLSDWMTALKDRDPAVRLRAVEVLGEVTSDQAGDQWSKLQIAVRSVAIQDKDPAVRKAAAFFSDLISGKLANAPELRKRMLEEWKRTVAPTLTTLHLVDAQDRPVAGAVVSSYFSRDCDKEPSGTTWESLTSTTSDAKGELALKLEILGHLDGEGLFAIRQDKGRPLVGLHRVTREEIGKPITIVMHPACRVLFQIDSTGLPALEKKYNVELTGPNWWRAAYLGLGNGNTAPRPLFTCSKTGALEFLLPPGRFTLKPYGTDVNGVDRLIEVKSDDRELFLGTIDLPPSENAVQGRFPNHHRVRLNRDVNRKENDQDFMLRRIIGRGLRGRTLGVHDVAFSPDGKLLATAHSYNADPGEVKLWDAVTGTHVATLPVAGKGFLALAFSPDGKFLAGRAYPPEAPGSSWGIVLWDVASRREVRTLRGHTGRILALAFSPDTRTLTSSSADKTTRFWDLASGRETGRIEGKDVWGRPATYSPDGKTLAIKTKLWDVAGQRLLATLEPPTERFAVQSIAYSPDGRTLAAAGLTYDEKGFAQDGQARLYDVAGEPFRRRAVLTFKGEGPGGLNQDPSMCSDIKFTPDGRRVVAVAMQKIRIWDVATATEQDAFQRMSSTASDRLAISPDGRWLAITGPSQVSILDISPPAP